MKTFVKVSIWAVMFLGIASCHKDSPTAPSAPLSDTEKPTVAILFPAWGAILKADTTYTVTVDARDNIKVTAVEFFVNGTTSGIDTVTPFEYRWNTHGLGGGQTISASAYDAAGNSGISSVVSVTVTPSPPQIDFWERCTTPAMGGPAAQFFSGRNGGLISAATPILRSVDTGRTWSEMTTPIGFQSLTVDGAGNLYGVGFNIFRSTDNGISWSNLGGGGVGGFLAILSNGWMLNVAYDGVSCFRSTNGGQSWISVAQVPGSAIYVFLEKRTNTVYVNTTSHGEHKMMWSSSDNGDSWSLAADFGGDMYSRVLAIDSTGRLLLLDNVGGLHIGFEAAVISRLPGGYPVLQVHPCGKLLAGGAGFFISSDGGLTWLEKIQGMSANDHLVWGIGILPDGRVLAGTSLGSIYRSKLPITN